jgi:hypothetical protein
VIASDLGQQRQQLILGPAERQAVDHVEDLHALCMPPAPRA